MNADLLWPRHATPGDVGAIERVPLADRGLPNSTYAVLQRAATLWPDRAAISAMPDADRWRQASTRTFSELLADVHRAANMLHQKGVQRHTLGRYALAWDIKEQP